MKNTLMKLDRLEEGLLAVLLSVMCLAIFVATFCRYTKLMIIPWAEEFSRYCMIWIIYLGISVAAKRGEHFYVAVITMMMPTPLKRLVAVIRTVLLVAFNMFIGYYSIVIMKNQIMMEQITPSLKWPMWVIYLAIPVGCTLMAIRYTFHTWMEMRPCTDSAECGSEP